MRKTILVTGSTDGIGLATARELISQGHKVLLHGRDARKLEQVYTDLAGQADSELVEKYVADLSIMADVETLAKAIAQQHAKLDVLINNAGVFRVAEPTTIDGLDVRFAVNTIAPYLLTQRLLSLFEGSGRVISLSSAAQSPVNTEALAGRIQISDAFEAYAQSKLALTMWSIRLSQALNSKGPAIIAVNPGSMLGSKMVREGFGVTGGDLAKGADILCRAALTEEFSAASGQYFDNDSGQFSTPHPEALNPQKITDVVRVIEDTLGGL
ncbi:MAG: SDR family NAD(P)-dependent oxidoreductase [Haliea sp.]|uniref:SDR family NAD(P)-dependent oxidoreductase n=1 Tax=Haliea sp. TaxID=1932666 RepID=UPI0032ED3E65